MGHYWSEISHGDDHPTAGRREGVMSSKSYTEADVVPLSVWRHVASGGLYVVMGVARCSTNGDREGVEQSVVYWSVARRHLNYREAGEFLDGRFVPVEGQ